MEALEVNPESYGCLLISILKKKLSEDIKISLLRDYGELSIHSLRHGLKREIEMKELSIEGGNFQTFSSMFVGNASDNCIFCEETHASENCSIVNDTDKRIQILKKQRRCFRCLHKNHMSKKCRADVKCGRCSGKHHEADCRSKD